MVLTPLQKLDNLGKIVVATGFEWLPKVRKLAQSGHTARTLGTTNVLDLRGSMSLHQ